LGLRSSGACGGALGTHRPGLGPRAGDVLDSLGLATKRAAGGAFLLFCFSHSLLESLPVLEDSSSISRGISRGISECTRLWMLSRRTVSSAPDVRATSGDSGDSDAREKGESIAMALLGVPSRLAMLVARKRDRASLSEVRTVQFVLRHC